MKVIKGKRAPEQPWIATALLGKGFAPKGRPRGGSPLCTKSQATQEWLQDRAEAKRVRRAAKRFVTAVAMCMLFVLLSLPAHAMFYRCWGNGRCNNDAVTTETAIVPQHFEISSDGKTVAPDFDGKQIRIGLADGHVVLGAVTTNKPIAAAWMPDGSFMFITQGSLLFHKPLDAAARAINVVGARDLYDVTYCNGQVLLADHFADSSVAGGGLLAIPWPPPSSATPTVLIPGTVAIGGVPVNPNGVWAANGVGCSAAGLPLVADTNTSRIVQRNANGSLTIRAGVTGQRGFSGDGGPATAAMLSFPTDVDEAADGTLFIADFGNNRIRQVRNGTISSVMGNGTIGTQGAFCMAGPTLCPVSQPMGVAFNDQGNVIEASSAWDAGIFCLTDALPPPMSPIASATATLTIALATATVTVASTATRVPATKTATPAPTCFPGCVEP